MQFRPLRRSPRKSAYTHCEAEREARKEAEREAAYKPLEREASLDPSGFRTGTRASPIAADPMVRTRPNTGGTATGTIGQRPRRHTTFPGPGSPPPPIRQAWRYVSPSASAGPDAFPVAAVETGNAGEDPAQKTPKAATAASSRPATAQRPCAIERAGTVGAIGTAPSAPSRAPERSDRAAPTASGVLGPNPLQPVPRPILMQTARDRDHRPSAIPRARSAEPCRQDPAEGGGADSEERRPHEALRFHRERAATAAIGDTAALQAQASPASPSSSRLAPFKTLPSGVFGGRFASGKYLGRGASATVWEATHSDANMRVAVKVFDQGSRDRRQAHREMRILGRLQHPSVLEAFEVVETSHFAQLICEYIDGESLRAFAQRQPNHRLEEDAARRFYRQVVHGVSYCHERLVAHRDIKLENLLIHRGQDQIKIIDFGFAAHVAAKDTKLRAFCGTPSYMAPEIIKGEGYSGFAADVWALGVVAFALLAGSLPFIGRTEMQLYAKIRRGVFTYPDTLGDIARRLIKGALRVDASARPSSSQMLHHVWVTGSGASGATQGGIAGKAAKLDGGAHGAGHAAPDKEALAEPPPRWVHPVPGTVLGGC